MGLSASAYAQSAAVLGAQLKNLGVAQKDLVPTTDTLIQMGADLSAQFGGSSADAVAALGSLLRGERDPIEKYGVSISAAAVAAELAAKGQSKLTGAAKKSAETQATLTLVTKQTASATGAFARESNTAAGQQARASAEWENAQAALGEALLPAMTAASSVLNKLSGFVKEHTGLVYSLVGVFVTLAVALKVAILYQKLMVAAQVEGSLAAKAVAAAQWLWNAALAANPIGLIVLAVIGLIALIVILWQRSETFRKIVTAAWEAVLSVVKVVWSWLAEKLAGAWKVIQVVARAVGLVVSTYVKAWVTVISAVVGWLRDKLGPTFDWLKSVAGKALQLVLTPLQAMWELFQKVWEVIKKVVDIIGKIKIPEIPSWLNPFDGGKAAPVAPSSAVLRRAPTGLGGRAGSGSSSGGGITVNVNGALDPQAVGRQVLRLMANASARGGRQRLANPRRTGVVIAL